MRNRAISAGDIIRFRHSELFEGTTANNMTLTYFVSPEDFWKGSVKDYLGHIDIPKILGQTIPKRPSSSRDNYFVSEVIYPEHGDIILVPYGVNSFRTAEQSISAPPQPPVEFFFARIIGNNTEAFIICCDDGQSIAALARIPIIRQDKFDMLIEVVDGFKEQNPLHQG